MWHKSIYISFFVAGLVLVTGCSPSSDDADAPVAETHAERIQTRVVVVTQYVTRVTHETTDTREEAPDTPEGPPPSSPRAAPRNFTTNILAFVEGEPVYADEFYTVFGDSNLQNLPRYLRDEIDRGRGELIDRLIHNAVVARAAEQEDFSDNPSFVRQRDAALRQLKMQYYYDRYVASRVAVLPEEIDEHYALHQEEFVTPERIRARHILVSVGPFAYPAEVTNAYRKIHRLRQRFLEGEAFEDIAREESDCPSASQGGDLDYFSRGQMVPAFEEVAFALRPNEVSNVVRTEFGYHIVQLIDRIPQRIRSRDEVKDEITHILEDRKERALYNEYFTQLTNTFKVERNEPLIRYLIHSL